jgi:rhodanese-related sulfurtransferase
MPDIRDTYLNEVEDISYLNSFGIKLMTSDELAFRIIDNEKKLQIIDFRSPNEFKKLNLPKSHSFTFNNLFEKDAQKVLALKNKINVFIADDELTARKAAVIAYKLGYEDVVILKGGLNEFKKVILEFKGPEKITKRYEEDTYHFREKASKIIPVLIEQNKNKIIPKKESKRVIGGC